jgi:hypothetical protein
MENTFMTFGFGQFHQEEWPPVKEHSGLIPPAGLLIVIQKNHRVWDCGDHPFVCFYLNDADHGAAIICDLGAGGHTR